jgi:glycerophosphoryl diester phosphodiesterase
MDISNYKFIAHRGLYSKNEQIPENSLGAFSRAIQRDLAIEFDVHITSDGKLVVFHDNNLKRITGIDKIIEDCTLDFLKELKLQNTTFEIPTLQEVLSLIDGKVPLLIEIKNERKVGLLEEKLSKTLKGYKGKYIIESFNPLSLLWFRKNIPNVSIGQLSSKNIDGIKSKFEKFVLENMLLNTFVKPDFIAYDIEYITTKLAKKCKRKNRFLLGWTIRNIESLNKAKELCDGIIFENIDLKELK